MYLMTFSVSAETQEDALYEFAGAAKLVKEMADGGHAAIRAEKANLTIQTTKQMPNPPKYEVLGLNTEGKHVIVRFMVPTVDIIPLWIENGWPLHGSFVDREGQPHIITAWTLLPRLA